MKITRLELTSFGKFQGFELSLAEDGAVFCEDNEFGKSTIADFICFMLFGFAKNRKKVEIGEDLLQKYMPWEGEKRLGGAMEFLTDEGKALRLEREQNEKGKGKCKLLGSDGTLLSEAEDIGETLTGIDRETFWQTFYFRQNSTSLQKTERIDIALKNLVTSGEEQLSFDSVMDKLWEENKLYRHRGKSGGGLAMTESRIADLTYEIAALEAEAERLSEGLSSREEVEQKLSLLDAEMHQWAAEKEAAKATAAAKKLRRIDDLCREKEETEARLSALPFQKLLDPSRLSALRAAEKNEQTLREQLVARASSPSADAKVAAMIAYMQNATAAEKHTLRSVGRVISALLLVVFALLPFVFGNDVWYFWILSALCGGVFAFLLPTPLPKALRAAGIRRKEVEHYRYLAEQAVREEKDRKEWIDKTTAAVAAAEQEKESLLHALGLSSMDALVQYEQCRDTLAALGQRLQMQREQWESETQGVDIDALRALAEKGGNSDYSPEECDRNLQEAQRQKAMLLQQTLQTDEARRRAERRRNEAVEKGYEKEALTKKLQKDRERSEILMLAMEGLQQAADILRESYAPMLQKRAGEKLNLITDGKYDTVMVDPQFGIKVKAAGAVREVGYFSAGTSDAVYLAVRLALAELVDAEQTMPLILDDPFVSMDSARRAALCEMLRKASGERQLIFFTCESTVAEALAK